MTKLDTYPPIVAVDEQIEELEQRVDEANADRAEAAEGIKEAEQVIETAKQRLDDLNAARELLHRSRPMKPGKPAANGKKKAGRPRKTSPRAQRGPAKASTPAKATPAKEKKEPEPQSDLAKVAHGRAVRMLEQIKERPGSTGQQIAEATGLHPSEVSKIGNSLCSQEKIHRRREGRVKRHYPGRGKAGADVADDQPKTGLERRVIEAIPEGGASDGEIASDAGVDTHVARQVLGALVRRRAVIMHRGGRYERPSHPRTMADRT
jgi:transcription initiation factor IIE alpha subunit